MAHESGVRKLVFQNVVGHAVQRQLLLAVNVLKAGQLAVGLVDLGGDVFADYGDLPDQPAQLQFDARHPHVAPQINNVV